MYLLREKFATMGVNCFPLRITLNEKGGKNENGRVVPPESVPMHLNKDINFKISLRVGRDNLLGTPVSKCTSTGLVWCTLCQPVNRSALNWCSLIVSCKSLRTLGN